MYKKIILFVALLMVGWVSNIIAAEFDAQPSSKDKCPVCGMFVAKYPDWICSVTFANAPTVYFDGPKDMFKYILDTKKYGSHRKAGDIKNITVMDYYRVAPIDGRSAFYVEGSDVYGPMGKELIALAGKSDANEFMKDHKGRRILRFSDVTRDVLKALDGQ